MLITDTDGGANTTASSASFVVSDAPLSPLGLPATVKGVAGQALSPGLTLGMFSDADGNTNAADHTGTIDRGDGSYAGKKNN